MLTLKLIFAGVQESSFRPWCSGRPVASSSAPSAPSSMWTRCSSKPVSLIFLPCSFSAFSLRLQCIDLCCLSPGNLGITPEDPRWIGAWWAGFLLCGALLFSSALPMFGFPQLLPTKEREEGAESEHVMLPPALSSDCETSKSSNGVLRNHEPANSDTCCQQLRGERARVQQCCV